MQLNNRSSKYTWQKVIELKRTDKSTIVYGDFNTDILATDRKIKGDEYGYIIPKQHYNQL